MITSTIFAIHYFATQNCELTRMRALLVGFASHLKFWSPQVDTYLYGNWGAKVRYFEDRGAGARVSPTCSGFNRFLAMNTSLRFTLRFVSAPFSSYFWLIPAIAAFGQLGREGTSTPRKSVPGGNRTHI